MVNMRADALRTIGAEKPSNLLSPEEVATFNAKTNGAMLFEDSLGVCRINTRTDVLLLTEAVNAATGWDMSVEEVMEIGRRAVNLLRAFNIRHGISPELDLPSTRYGSAPIDGPVAGKTVQPHWNQMLADYYRLMGWDESGVPKRETLEALEIGKVADDLGL